MHALKEQASLRHKATSTGLNAAGIWVEGAWCSLHAFLSFLFFTIYLYFISIVFCLHACPREGVGISGLEL